MQAFQLSELRVNRKGWEIQWIASIPCKALHQTGWAGRLPAWPLSSWRTVCRAWCSSCCGGSLKHKWSEPAPGTPGGPKHNKGDKQLVPKFRRKRWSCYFPCLGFSYTDLPSENNLCCQPQWLPSLHQNHRSSPPGLHGSTSSGQCSHPRYARPCCLRPGRSKQ